MTYLQIEAIAEMVSDASPITPADASSQLQRLALTCAEDGVDPVRSVRNLLLILEEIAPKLSFLTLGLDREKIDRLLQCGGAESAAIRLAGPDVGFLVSRGPHGRALASAWIPDRSEELTVESSDPASALCGAIALSCAQAIGSGPEPVSIAVN